jgi:thioredoxin-like negative regulator of GroEL
MKIFNHILFFLTLLSFSLTQEKQKPFEKENNIIVLNDDNFERAITTYKNVLVHFYIPWCSHS